MIAEKIENLTEDIAGADVAESLLRKLDKRVAPRTHVSLFHILTAASIVGSIFLFLRGKKMEAIFVGLWPATFQALKSATMSRR
jgi:hypothetical protein